MASSKSLATLMLVTALVIILMVGETRAQIPECASKLIGCANFLNSTKPPESCCKPLKEAVATQRVCLCNLYNDPTLLPSLGINITQALALTRTCGASADTSLCSNSTAPAPATTTPLTPPSGVAGRDGNSAGKMAWSGGSGLLLLWVSIMAF